MLGTLAFITTNAMQPEPAPSPPINPLEGFFSHHLTVLAVLAICFLLVSLCLIWQMWSRHRKNTFYKKLVWTFILLVPLAGWLAYGGLFHPPGYSDTPGFVTGGPAF